MTVYRNLKLVLWVMMIIGVSLLVWVIIAGFILRVVDEFNKLLPVFIPSMVLIIIAGFGLDSIKSKDPVRPSSIFKINDLVDLRLIGKETYIYVNNKILLACKSLLFNIPKRRIREIKSIDEASIVFKSTEKIRHKISSKEEFMGHCSNIQAFIENGLNTDILSTNVAFPLLKKLVDNGYEPAIRVFKQEIIKRFNEGTYNSRTFLYLQGYLYYLKEEEKLALNGLDPISGFPSLTLYLREKFPLDGDNEDIFDGN